MLKFICLYQSAICLFAAYTAYCKHINFHITARLYSCKLLQRSAEAFNLIDAC